MADIKFVIQHGGSNYEPPVEDGLEIEWEKVGSPGKLTCTILKTDSVEFEEGDAVKFYYGGTPMFLGYIFTKSRDKENRIKLTCYDQLRYFKNKFSYVFENKKASEILSAICSDYGMSMGSIEDTKYIISGIAEENVTAFDIVLKAIKDTLTNTGNLYILYDNFGKITLKNAASMVSNNLIAENTAENFDYSSSIDDETYNSIVLYYKDDNNKIIPVSAMDNNTISKWGLLRYFEEVKVPAIAQNKANALLSLYNKKSRKLTIKNAFGSADVRGGTLIPVKLDLGDTKINNYMIVEKVKHKFDADYYTMDLTLDGGWNDKSTVSTTTTTTTPIKTQNYGTCSITLMQIGYTAYSKGVEIGYYYGGQKLTASGKKSIYKLSVDANSALTIIVTPNPNADFIVSGNGFSSPNSVVTTTRITKNTNFTVEWKPK